MSRMATPSQRLVSRNFIPDAHKYVFSVLPRYWNHLAWLQTQPLKGFRLLRCRLGDDREGMVWLTWQGDFVTGQVSEIPEHGTQAADVQAGFGGPGCGLPLCPLGHFGLLYGCLSLGPCALGVVVLEQHRRQVLAQVPFEIVSEHAQEELSTDMTPDLQRDVMRGTGVAPGKVYGGRASGTPDDRPGLENRLRALGEGDVPVVSRLHRLGCKLTHLVRIVETLSNRGIGQRGLIGQGAVSCRMAKYGDMESGFSALGAGFHTLPQTTPIRRSRGADGSGACGRRHRRLRSCRNAR